MSNNARNAAVAEAQRRAAAKRARDAKRAKQRAEEKRRQQVWRAETQASNRAYSGARGLDTTGKLWHWAIFPVIVLVFVFIFGMFAGVGDWRWLIVWLALCVAVAVAALLRRLFVPERIHWIYDLVVGGGILFGAALLALRLWSTVSLGY